MSKWWTPQSPTTGPRRAETKLAQIAESKLGHLVNKYGDEELAAVALDASPKYADC